MMKFTEFELTLTSAQYRFENRYDFLKELVSNGFVFLFGYGGKGKTLALHIAKNSNFKIIIFDSSPEVRDLAAQDGFPTVTSLEELRQTDGGVILGACQAQIEQATLLHGNHIFYQEAAYLFDAPHLANKAREFSNWTSDNKEDLYEIYTSIHPDSQVVFLSVLRFRLSLDPHDLLPGKKANIHMWFDVPEHYCRRDYTTFLDVGAFDGDTLLQAKQRLSFTRGIAVEANKSFFDSIKNVAQTYQNGVKIIPYAAWSHKCRLRYSEVRGGMISVSEADDGQLEAARIDKSLSESVDFIKMDIEGAELPALTGCLEILKTGPDLAIAAYHRPADLVQIPTFLSKAGYVHPTFDLHFGHYSDCLDDTIIYLVKSH